MITFKGLSVDTNELFGGLGPWWQKNITNLVK
jgi:hypothetical protein